MSNQLLCSLMKMFSFLLIELVYLVIIGVSSTTAQSSSLCAQYYPHGSQQPQCECEDTNRDNRVGVTLKCHGHTYVPHFLPNIHYHSIELESCAHDLQIGDKTFADLNINTLRLRSCNLIGLNEESFAKINRLERFTIENSTINSLVTNTGNFQDIFQADSFQTIKTLVLKSVHYHQLHKHDKKLNLELLLDKLPQLHRLELTNIYLDNYRHLRTNITSKYLTYLKLINTRQTSLLPLESLPGLESLILVQTPDIFRHQPLFSSLKLLKNLKYIDFSHNGLTNLDGLESKTIDQIDLSSNALSHIDEYAFEHVPKLRTLTLNGNSLQSIDSNAFCGIEHLERLYINTQKSGFVSPLDNCLLINYPSIDIKQDGQSKFQCDCRLVNVFHEKRQQKVNINRLLKPNDLCLVTNQTLDDARDLQQLINHYNLPIHVYDLEKYLNCSTTSIQHVCSRPCQERKVKVTTPLITTAHPFAPTGKSNSKTQSKTTSLNAFFSYTLFSLLLAFLYL